MTKLIHPDPKFLRYWTFCKFYVLKAEDHDFYYTNEGYCSAVPKAEYIEISINELLQRADSGEGWVITYIDNNGIGIDNPSPTLEEISTVWVSNTETRKNNAGNAFFLLMET